VGGGYTDPATDTKWKRTEARARHDPLSRASPKHVCELVQGLARVGGGCADNAGSSSRSRSGAILAFGAIARFAPREPRVPGIVQFSNRPLSRQGGPYRILLDFRFPPTPFSSPFGIATYVKDIQLTMAEDFGGGRGAFLREVGAFARCEKTTCARTSALIAMDPPTGQEPEAMRRQEEAALVPARGGRSDPKEVVRGAVPGHRALLKRGVGHELAIRDVSPRCR